MLDLTFDFIPFCFATSLVEILRQLNIFTAPLEFLSLMNNGMHFEALVDSGAQLNLVNSRLLPFLTYKKVESPIKQIQGVGGNPSVVNGWVQFMVALQNNQKVEITAAVLPNIKQQCIVGCPFLYQVKAVIDHFNGVITTELGSIPLLLKFPNTLGAYSLSPGNLVSQADSVLTESQLSRLHRLIQNFPGIWDDRLPGIASTITHRIIISSQRPVVTRPRRHSPEQQKVIADEINKMLLNKVIRPSKSQYVSEIVMVPKKPQGWRMCIDYRNLNSVTIPDRYPLPRISDLLSSVKNTKFFVSLDLRAGYWQIPLDEESKQFTAFRCVSGLFEFDKMPFGLSNAPATFQRMMDFLFGDLRFSGVLVYLDDILIHGQSVECVLELLETVLGRLQEAGLKLNKEKCVFFPASMRYLGHILQDGCLIPDPEKVKALSLIKQPKTAHDLRSILGFVGYYQQYIPNFSRTLAPVFDILKTLKNTKMMNKKTKIDWEPAHWEALNKVINSLSVSVLKIPLETDNFLVETDASNDSVAATLSCQTQNSNWAPVEFASKKLSGVQKRWPIREKEAFAIVFAVNKFDHYLRGRRFQVHTDHESLQWMLKAQAGKISRWASRLAEFEMEIFYKKGKELAHIDFLTRFLDTEADDDIAPRMTYNVATVAVLPAVDKVLELQKEGPVPTGKGYFERDGVIYFRNGIFVPLNIRVQIIKACHSMSPFRHPGVRRTKRLITKVFNWPYLHQDITKFIKSCLECQRSRPGLERLQGLLQIHPIPSVFETIYMDYWECTYRQESFVVLTMVDQFSKWAECVIINDKTVSTVTSAFLKCWVCRFGVPKTLITDNDKTFTSQMFQRLCCQLGISQLRITPYHPEGNAPVEAFHKTLKRGLMQFSELQNNAVSFDEALQLVLFSYRSVVHSTTNESPGFLCYGVDLRPAMDNDWRIARSNEEENRLKVLNNMRLDIQFQAVRNCLSRIEAQNKNRNPLEFHKNDLILSAYSPSELLHVAHSTGEHVHKLIPRWSLPYRVISVHQGGKKAIAKSLITGINKEVHIQDARFILPPENEIQKEEWNAVVNAELSMLDSGVRKAQLQQFWESLESVPTELSVRSNTKRRRQNDPSSVLGGV